MSHKLSKSDRKIIKKQKKTQETLLKHENIICSTTPTKYLFVANGGFLNGVSREDIYLLFIDYGSVTNIYMKEKKPYCFVEYSKISEAEEAVRHIHGQNLKYFEEISRPDLILYLSYTNEVIVQDGNRILTKPPGLDIVNDFITLEEEQQLLDCLDWEKHELLPEDQNLKHRRVKHFGYRFDYKTNKIDKENPLDEAIPECCCGILERLSKDRSISPAMDQLTVNQYQPGQGIPPHVDSHSSFEGDIIIISLGSQTVMDFKSPDGAHYPADLPARSVAVVSGDCRYSWTHGMTPRASDVVVREGEILTLARRGVRTSFTFRKVRTSPCSCNFPELCDSEREQKLNTQQFELNDKTAQLLEREHVYKVYNEIADHFSNTRHTPWPKVVGFLNSLERGSLVLDVGCGNGKYLGIRKEDICMIGCDASQKLCEINSSLSREVQMCNILQFPYHKDAFDAVICIAVIHHLASQERRESSLREICRVLRPGGRALIYVWAMEQQRNGVKSNYVKKSPTEDGDKMGTVEDGLQLPIHKNGTEFRAKDNLVPWHYRTCGKEASEGGEKDEKIRHRFYHVFSEGELERLCQSAWPIKIADTFYDQGNWCIEFLK